jgi:hypothetical protein
MSRLGPFGMIDFADSAVKGESAVAAADASDSAAS